MNYNELTKRLSLVSPDEFEFEARVLIESFCDKKISYILANRDDEIGSEALLAALERREAREPLQYIVGKWDFFRQTYFVDENCLIPRADTEILVEKAIELLPYGAHFADLCAGSGCIAISTLCERPDTTAVMVDKFKKTLALAVKNAEANDVSQRVQPMMFDVLCDEQMLAEERFDAILSNPPYIRPEVIEALSPEVKREPYEALYGGDDGLIFYRKIVADYSKFLKKDGFFVFEIGYDQAADLCNIAAQHGLTCEIIKDYAGNDRVAILRR